MGVGGVRLAVAVEWVEFVWVESVIRVDKVGVVIITWKPEWAESKRVCLK